MRSGGEWGPSIVTPLDMSWHTIKAAYLHGHYDPEQSLYIGQEYAARVAEEQKDRLAFMHVPYELLEEENLLGSVYAVEGMSFRLGPRLRRQVEFVRHPDDLPANSDWVAVSGGDRVVLAPSTIRTIEYLESLLATRNSPRGRAQLIEFLYGEAVSLALSDGEKVFMSPEGRFLHTDNMFSALARSIEPLVVPPAERQRRRTLQQAPPIRRGNLVLVR